MARYGIQILFCLVALMMAFERGTSNKLQPALRPIRKALLSKNQQTMSPSANIFQPD